MESRTLIETLTQVSNDPNLLEIGRRAIEDELVDLRDRRIGILFRGNGFVIKERNGESSDIIRLSSEDGIKIALKAIADHIAKDGAE